MRWLWIDRIVSLESGSRLVAVKQVSFGEDHLHDHFPACTRRGLDPAPVAPASLIIEGMAQSAGILVGEAGNYKEKVILAKISRVELSRDVRPGCTIRFTATMERLDALGASTTGVVEAMDPQRAGEGFVEIGRIDLMFSHVDHNMAGIEFPEENFVFTELFATLLRESGLPTPE